MPILNSSFVPRNYNTYCSLREGFYYYCYWDTYIKKLIKRLLKFHYNLSLVGAIDMYLVGPFNNKVV